MVNKTKPKFDLTDFEFTEAELIAGLSSPVWRLNNLYKIVNDKKKVVTFRLNQAQQQLLNGLHTRNLILKARKMGFSTFIQVFMLDTALFSPNERGVVICQDRETAEAIFRDVFKFAYDNLPTPFKIASPTDGAPSKSSIAFTNNSVVEVRTSARGGTPTFLHISEFGKIAAKDPGKAKEIITGSITAVAEDGMVFVESTAEGQEGEFYKMVDSTRNFQDSGQPHWKIDFKFHFFGWWQDARYTAPANSVVVSAKDHEYFDDLELQVKHRITPEQRSWYVKYRDVTYSGDQEMMWQEMPATPDEAFKVSLEGAYFKEQFRALRKEQRIGDVPYDDMYPVSLFFDIGASDETAIWFIQPRRTHYAVIDFLEASGKPFSYFVKEVDKKQYVLDTVYLPHDAAARKQGADRNMTPEEMLQSVAPHWRLWLVPRTPDKQMAISQARIFLGQCVFDQAKCDVGLKHLQAYRKTWNARTATWSTIPRHGPESNAADALLQAAQAKAGGSFSAVGNTHSFASDFEAMEPAPMGF